MLMSAGLPLPEQVFGRNCDQDGQKMGKVLVIPSLWRWSISHGADAVRYYFLKGSEFSKDGDFPNETRFISS